MEDPIPMPPAAAAACDSSFLEESGMDCRLLPLDGGVQGALHPPLSLTPIDFMLFPLDIGRWIDRLLSSVRSLASERSLASASAAAACAPPLFGVYGAENLPAALCWLRAEAIAPAPLRTSRCDRHLPASRRFILPPPRADSSGLPPFGVTMPDGFFLNSCLPDLAKASGGTELRSNGGGRSSLASP